MLTSKFKLFLIIALVVLLSPTSITLAENKQKNVYTDEISITDVETCGITGANEALTITDKDIVDVDDVINMINKEFVLNEESNITIK